MKTKWWGFSYCAIFKYVCYIWYICLVHDNVNNFIFLSWKTTFVLEYSAAYIWIFIRLFRPIKNKPINMDVLFLERQFTECSASRRHVVRWPIWFGSWRRSRRYQWWARQTSRLLYTITSYRKVCYVIDVLTNPSNSTFLCYFQL